MELEIKGFIETSLVDWDGRIASVVFLPGCNFNCPFCHNIDLVKNPDQLKSVSVNHIKDYLIKHKDFIDGICITGGEPTLHINKGLSEFIKTIKSHGFLVKLDTNGTMPNAIKDLVSQKLIDYIAMDIKAPPDEQYHKTSGVQVDLNKIKESIKYLLGNPIDYEFRTTAVPTMIDIQGIENIAKELRGAKRYYIQQFEPANCPDPELKKLKPFDKSYIEEMVEVAKQYIHEVKYRGK